MPKNAHLVSRFSSDGEDSLIDRPPQAIDLTSRGAFQPFGIQDGVTTGTAEKENEPATGDAPSQRRRRKSTFIRRLTSKLRLVPHASNTPQSPPPGPLSPSYTTSPTSPRVHQQKGHVPTQKGYFPAHPNPPLAPDLSVQELEQDRQLDAYFPPVADDTLSEDDDEDWMTEARRIREDLETRWHSDGSGVRKTPIYPEVLATPQFGKAKSTTDLRAVEPTPHFAVVREFTVLRPQQPSVVPPVELIVDDASSITARATTDSLQPPPATLGSRIRAQSLSPRASRASLQPPPGPPPDRELPAIPSGCGSRLMIPRGPSQPQSLAPMGPRTQQTVSANKDNYASEPTPRTSGTDSAGSITFPSADEAVAMNQNRPNAASPAPSKPASQEPAAEAPADPRGRSQRRKSFVEQSLESIRKSFSKSRPTKPPPLPPKFDASQLPPPPPMPLSVPLSPTTGSFLSSGRSSAASAPRPSGSDHP